MLSLILYGRNDSHGYNLHKRAAISLNCLAELMGGDDDEICFVDYNTPDTFPTFPEAIADTLTQKARNHLRVFRVRPDHHHTVVRPFTHLDVCEPLARNIALRRANPANPWVLSTNTDMILVPKGKAAEWREILVGLPPCCHHLPRFELPQGLWEEFDRLAPQGTIRFLSEMGARLHLHEVVAGSPPARFDNHGDFQLIPRAELEAIHGFDERMRSGWIVDSNTAKRLAMRLGEPRSLEENLAGFHCDHTRGGGQCHGHNHVENDYRRFYLDMETAELPHQAETWGAAGQHVEEIRLKARTTVSLSSVLTRVLPPPRVVPTHSTYRPDVSDVSAYSPEHVLPFLADIFIHLPRNVRLAWFGTGQAIVTMAASIWAEMEFQTPFSINDPDAVATADLFVFEFGRSEGQEERGETGWTDTELDALAPVHDAFLRLTEQEARRLEAGRSPRIVVTVNAINNRFEAMVHDCLDVSRTPFGSRVRHGRVLPGKAQPLRLCPPDLAQWLGRRLDRCQPVPVTEAVRLLSVLEALLGDDERDWHLPAAARVAETALAGLDFPPLAGRHPASRLAALRLRIAAARPSAGLNIPALHAAATVYSAPLEAPSRVVRLADWEDAVWLNVARRFVGGAFAGNMFRRSQTQWLATQIVAVAKRADVLGPGNRVLLDVQMSGLASILSRLVGQVAVTGDISDDGFIRVPGRLSHCRMTDATGRFDMAVVGDDGALMRAAGLLAPQGLVAVVRWSAWDQTVSAPPVPAGLTILPIAAPGLTRDAVDLFAGQDSGYASVWFLRA